MSKFRDSRNRFVTNGLFEETATGTTEFVLMSLSDGRKRYLEEKDPTGFCFADKFLESYQHWKELKESAVLAPIIREWEEELETLLKSEALKHIVTLSETGHFQASKFLVDGGWNGRKAGRPSKEEITKETKVQSNERKEYKADVARLTDFK